MTNPALPAFGAPAEPPKPRRRWPLWLQSAVIMAAITALLFVIEAIDYATNHQMDDAGIEPREADGLLGVLVSPFLHADWNHLLSNAYYGVVLGFLLLMAKRFVATTAIVWLTSGFGVWLFGADHSVTIGASGVIFGWLTFILARGVFNRSPWQIVLGIVVLILYGGALWGVLPGDNGVSWQAHLFGAAGGVLAAWLFSRRDREHRTPKQQQSTIPGQLA